MDIHVKISRLRIGGLMAILALDFGILRMLIPRSDYYLFRIISAWPMANVLTFACLAISRRGREQAFFFGFVCYGLAAMLSFFIWAWLFSRGFAIVLRFTANPIVGASGLGALRNRLPVNLLTAFVIFIPQFLLALTGGSLFSWAELKTGRPGNASRYLSQDSR
jgi:hypothetical protein